MSHPATSNDMYNTALPPTSRIPTLPPSINYIDSFIDPAEETALLAQISRHPWTHLAHRKLQAHPGPLSPAGALLAAPLPPFLQPLADRIAALGVFDVDEQSGGEQAEWGVAEQEGVEPSERAEADLKGAAAGTAQAEGDTIAARRRAERHPTGAPNHVLINAYAPGQGIHAHEDGPAYAAIVATVSLGGSVVLDVVPRPAVAAAPPKTVSLPHPPRDSTPTSGSPAASAASPSVFSSPTTTTTTQQGPATPQRILQPPRSLLVTRGAAYTSLLHGIAGVHADADLGEATLANWTLLSGEQREAVRRAGGVLARGPGERVSLTFRRVLKVRRVGGGVLKNLGARR